MYSAGVFVHGAPALFDPLEEEFGWSSASITIALTLQRLEGGLVAPITGAIFDRFGPRVMVLSGLTIMSLGFVIISQTQSLWMFYLGFIVTAFGHSFASPIIGLATVSQWFKRNRGKASALVLSGGGIAGIMVPVMVLAIDMLGWRTAMLIAAGGFWLSGLPLALVVKHKPEDHGYLPDGDTPESLGTAAEQLDGPAKPVVVPGPNDFTLRQAMRTRTFWLLGLAYALVQLTISSVLVHALPFLDDVGISRTTAGFTIAAVTITSVVGRVGFGWLADSFNKRYLLVVAVILQASGVLVFMQVTSVVWLIPFVILYGLGFGGGLPVRPALQGDYFGRAHFGTIQGIFIGMTSVASVASPLFAAVIRDRTDEFSMAFYILAAASLLAVPVFLLAKNPGPKSLYLGRAA